MWTDIRWKDVAQKFPDGFTPEFLRSIAYRLIKSYQKPKKWLKEPLMDIVSHTLYKVQNINKKSYRLKTLTLSSEGMLKERKHSVKMDFLSIN